MSRTLRRLCVAVLSLGLVAGAGATTASAQHHAPAQTPPPDITDAAFLAQAAASNQFEIVTGRLATQRARARIVRRLGRQFVEHHTAALQAGAAVAAKLGIPAPPTLTPEQQAIVNRLNRLRGRAFDRAWVKAQLLAHEQAVALHLAGALTGDTPDVRTLAINGLPVVAGHLGELTVVARRF